MSRCFEPIPGLACRALLTAALVVVGAGCIYIPAPDKPVEDGMVVPDSVIGAPGSDKPIQPYTSTRGDVERVFGKLHYSVADQRIWVYPIEMKTGTWLVLPLGVAPARKRARRRAAPRPQRHGWWTRRGEVNRLRGIANGGSYSPACESRKVLGRNATHATRDRRRRVWRARKPRGTSRVTFTRGAAMATADAAAKGYPRSRWGSSADSLLAVPLANARL